MDKNESDLTKFQIFEKAIKTLFVIGAIIGGILGGTYYPFLKGVTKLGQFLVGMIYGGIAASLLVIVAALFVGIFVLLKKLFGYFAKS